MKIANLLFIIFCLNAVKAYDDTLYMYFDLEGMVEGFDTQLEIMKAGVFQESIANFANGFPIPAQVVECKLKWYASSNMSSYRALVIADEPAKLGVSLSIPLEGRVSTGTHQMTLQVRYFNKDFSQEYQGFKIRPQRVCEKIDYDPCTYYHDSITTSSKNNYYFSSINLQPYDDDDDDTTLKRFKDAYYDLQNYCEVISVQGLPTKLREEITTTIKGAYPYRIPYPHIRGEVQAAPLYVLSKNPIYTCNYFEFDEFHEYGAVIAGIVMGNNRIAFIINAMFPVVDEGNIDAIVNKVATEIKDAIDNFMKDHEKYYYDGYFFGNVNFDTELELSFLNKLNNTVGTIIGTNIPGEELVLGYKGKTANTTVLEYKTRKIGNINYTIEGENFAGAIKDGALFTKVNWVQEDEVTSDSASSLFTLICYILVLLSILIIM